MDNKTSGLNKLFFRSKWNDFIATLFSVEDPSTRVQFLIGEDADKDGETIVRPIFSEMETLVMIDNQYQWKETARWENLCLDKYNQY